MAKRGPTTFLKRQREMEAKRLAAEKRQRRAERRDAPPVEPDIVIHKPFVDDEQT
jgi:hypothetical protein